MGQGLNDWRQVCAVATGYTREELKFREFPVATWCCSLLLEPLQGSGCQMQPAGEAISCAWQRAMVWPWECISCQMSAAWDLTDLFLLWDDAASYFRDQSCTCYYLYLFIHSFMQFLPQTSVEWKLGHQFLIWRIQMRTLKYLFFHCLSKMFLQ